MNKSINPAKRYLLSLESEQSRSSMNSLLNVAAGYFEPDADLSTYDWSLLNIDDVYRLRDSLRRKKKAPSTINTYLAALKGVAKEAWRLKLISIDNYQQIKEIKRAKGARESTSRALSLKELNDMLDHCMVLEGIIAMRDAALIALVYCAGLRRHEAAGLILSGYSKRQAKITVIGKGNKERSNPLNSRVIDIIECWLDERGRKPGPLFTRVFKGNRITELSISPQTVYDIIVRRYKEAGLKKMTPHDLRRTYATNLLANGEDLFVVQDLMNHASLETTKKYDKSDDKMKIKAAKALPL